MTDTKLLGVIVSQDLKWGKNTELICQKARRKLWILRRLRLFNFSLEELFDVYTKEVRSILELAVPVWHSSLTVRQSDSIERIQKLAFRIILNEDYTSYEDACETFSTLTLKERRVKLCLKFARKNLKSEFNLFTKVSTDVQTRRPTKPVLEPWCNFGRYKKSSIPYIDRLLNSESK